MHWFKPQRKSLVIAAGLLLATPLAALAQPQPDCVVQDSAGHTLGPLSSSDAISQGAVIRIRTADQTICGGGDNDCDDAEYLLMPWTTDGPGAPIGYQNNQMPVSLSIYFTDSACATAPYLMVQNRTNSAAKPYDVIGGQGNDLNAAGTIYYPGTPIETARQLGITYMELQPFTEYGVTGLPPAFTASGECVPAWILPSALFAPAETLDISAEALEQDGFEPPYTLLNEAPARDDSKK